VREEVVTIEHGGRRVVKVTREPASSPAPLELTASEKLDRAKEGWDEASSLFQQGQKLRDSDPLEAERCLRRALALFEQLDKEFPGTQKYRGSLGPCRWYLASALNMQSHQFVFQSPPPTSQEAARAIALSKEAVALTPHTKEWLSNLGRAYYRAGDWNNAKMTLEEALAVGKAVEVDRFFLAMTHWQLGDKDQARRLYDGMVELLTKTPSRDRYVLRTRAEAAAVLGVEATSP
jgi:tetratricopeptide (TPR) repeat protein